MGISIKTTKLVSDIIVEDISFPYYAWNYDNRRGHIIKLDLEYYADKTIARVHCVEILNTFSVDPRINVKTILATNNVIDEDIIYLLRDFNIPATQQEFNQFKKETLKKIFK